ncbi:hypothetical protein SR1949_21310 [Sphaerospermopsis reniformis]|uniref:Uncharacterized protein n=1 Tax=Sphaerospermopsis reniformis TaxID=531300 RepID=A0A480A491_9CYAN|nr:hypothetical protein SR1949_21310 [Sphaerospermopsis reniformis]
MWVFAHFLIYFDYLLPMIQIDKEQETDKYKREKVVLLE